MPELNAMRWDGGPGHYEVWFLTLTDPGSGTGVWIRFAIHAPDDPSRAAECSLWFVTIDPNGERLARRATFPADDLAAQAEPFRITIREAELSSRGTAGAFDDVSWELRWDPSDRPGLPVHPLLEKARLARTMYVIPQPNVAVQGSVTAGGRTIDVSGARAAQAHLWGSKHASRWGWTHAADLESLEGEPRPGDWIDGISIVSQRFGRDVGPSTAVVGTLLGEPFAATNPISVLRAKAEHGLTHYRVETSTRSRRIAFEVDAPREALVGVTYEDPDGELMRCWNTEVATMRLWVWDRARRGRFPWALRETLQAPGRACFEYAQRDIVPGMPIDIA